MTIEKLSATLLDNLTFRRQLDITVTLGILLLALFSSIVGSWHGNKRVRDDLIEQGRRISESLARQSALALVFDSADNAKDAVNATLDFPGVIGVKIFHADGRLLLTKGDDEPKRPLVYAESARGLQSVIVVESADSWVFAAPVYSQPFAESPFGDAVPPELLGHVSVAMSKEPMDRLTSGIFVANLTASFSFALFFLLLIRILSRNMARPLDELSKCMARARVGESNVRAQPSGPKDIASMAHAFNDMMEVQEERESVRLDVIHQLEEKELAKSRFLAAAGHDLRQPLTAANLFVNMLKRTSVSTQQNDVIQQLEQAMDTFDGLLDTLLHVSKLDAGVIKPKYMSIDVAEIFSWLSQNFAALANEKKIDLRLHSPMKGKLLICSDIGLVNSVLMNLVSNAIKFTSHSPILVSARRRKDKVLFQVWDTGAGIPEEFIAHIFDEFYQIGNPQRDRSQGLGLGLSIVKRALALLDSKISCRSKVGQGSVFEFSLPMIYSPSEIASQPNAARAEVCEMDQQFAQGKHFLVLDDDLLVAKALVTLLEGMGGKVDCFHSAEEALHHPSIEHADYFIIDYMLGGSLNGIQFLNLARQKLGHPIHAVLMTGDTSTEFIREAANCEWPALHKPINITRLQSALCRRVTPESGTPPKIE